MEPDDVWRAIDAERLDLAGLLDGLTAGQWEVPSLCDGWRVRDVAAHLTLAQTGAATAVRELLRAGGSMNRMIRDTAVRQARLPVSEFPARLRAMAGSRKKAPGISHLEPLIDILVHGQDIAIPLGIDRPMPAGAAVAAADRVWPDLFPWRAGRRLRGLRFAATDCSWTAGEGALVEGPIAAILLAITLRPAAVDRLHGPGVPDLEVRLAPGGRSRRPAARRLPAVG